MAEVLTQWEPSVTRDEDKTKEQLIGELSELRRQVISLEAEKIERSRKKDTSKNNAHGECRNLLQLVLDAIPVRVFWVSPMRPMTIWSQTSGTP